MPACPIRHASASVTVKALGEARAALHSLGTNPVSSYCRA
jgi:hypothetical protein